MSLKKNSTSKSDSVNQGERLFSTSVKALTQGILQGNTTSLARAITLIESNRAENSEKAHLILEECRAHAVESIRIGVTGVPGVGKSTFIEALGMLLTGLGKKVAVLAIDPTSSETRGSILGDKTRMPELVKNPNAFIRPSPSGDSLGGVSRKTRESILLCEAAGFDVVLIETVGVGQSETVVHSMVDFFLLLKLPGAGDELQGIKRGIIEMADAIVINKADGDSLKASRVAQLDFNRALQLYPPKDNGWMPKVLSCSALHHEGIAPIWELIEKHHQQGLASGNYTNRRKAQNKYWLLQTIEERLKRDFYGNEHAKNALDKMIQAVMEGKVSPFVAAEQLLELYKSKSN